MRYSFYIYLIKCFFYLILLQFREGRFYSHEEIKKMCKVLNPRPYTYLLLPRKEDVLGRMWKENYWIGSVALNEICFEFM